MVPERLLVAKDTGFGLSMTSIMCEYLGIVHVFLETERTGGGHPRGV